VATLRNSLFVVMFQCISSQNMKIFSGEHHSHN
jgi:hypothetical protein